MLLIPLILKRLLQLLEPENPLINNRLDPRRIDRPIHLPKLQPTTHQHSPHNTNMAQTLQETRLIFALTSKESYDADHTLELDGRERLRHCFRPADFDDMVDTYSVRGEFLGLVAPIRVGFIVEDVVGAEGFQCRGFGVG